MLLLVFSLNATPKGTQRNWNGWRSGNGTRLMRVLETKAETLGLSEQQLKEIKTLCTANAEQNVALTNKNNLLKLELDKLMLEEKPDYNKIKNVMSQMSDIRIEHRINSMKNREKIMNTLTPEQRKMLGDSLKTHMKRQDRIKNGRKRGERQRDGRLGRISD